MSTSDPASYFTKKIKVIKQNTHLLTTSSAYPPAPGAAFLSPLIEERLLLLAEALSPARLYPPLLSSLGFPPAVIPFPLCNQFFLY